LKESNDDNDTQGATAKKTSVLPKIDLDTYQNTS